jgi:hypothetical protein
LPANPGEPGEKEGPMHVAKRIVSLVFVQLLLLAVVRTAGAADAKESMEKLKALSQSAAASYGDGDFDKTRSQLQEAVTLAKESGLGSNRIMAQIYILFGVLKINEHKDTEAGVRYFAKALDISPAVKIPPTMATKAVKAAFAKAEDVDPATIGDLSEVDAPTSAKKPSKKEKDKEKEEAAAAAAAAAEQERQEKQEKTAAAASSAADKKQAELERRQAEAERKRAEAERKKTDTESKALADDLAQTKTSEAQAKADRDKLKTQLGEAKGYLQQLEKEKAAKDKQIADANTKIQQLEKDKADRDAKLGPAGAKILQLEKDKAEKDKQIAALTASDKKERETREKLEKTMAEVAARERERRSKEIEERQEKEKMAEGGELPGHIREPVTCDLPDEIPAGEDLYVHCVPQPGVGAKMLAFYYRSGGSALYNAVTLERSRKGWYVTTIPGGKVSGRLLHYYVEARDAKEKVAASNGKATSPNVVTVRPGGMTAAKARGKK